MTVAELVAASRRIGRRATARVAASVRSRGRRALLPVWTEARTVRYGAAPDQVLDVLRPRWPARAPRPVVIVFHGGGWRLGQRAAVVHRVCRRYLERGFVAVNVEYRRAGIVPASADAHLALAWTAGAIARHGGDPARLVATGESAGAHLALLAAFAAPGRVRAVVDFFGVADPTTYAGARHDDSVPPGEVEATLRRLSPLHLAGPAACPVLAIHGTADPVVPSDQTTRLVARLRELGVPAGEILVPGGDHGFDDPTLDALDVPIFRFVRAHVT